MNETAGFRPGSGLPKEERLCGRFERVTPIKVLETLFDCPEAPPETPTHYNVAPSQPAAVVRVIRAAHDTGQREMTIMRWGLIPSWADDPAIGNGLINARSETAAEKPSFRAALKQRRCLVTTRSPYVIFLPTRRVTGGFVYSLAPVCG